MIKNVITLIKQDLNYTFRTNSYSIFFYLTGFIFVFTTVCFKIEIYDLRCFKIIQGRLHLFFIMRHLMKIAGNFLGHKDLVMLESPISCVMHKRGNSYMRLCKHIFLPFPNKIYF